MPKAFISLGSNSPDAAAMLQKAIAKIRLLAGCTMLRTSSVYLTEPQDYPDQPWFHNQILELATTFAPQALLRKLLDIESRLGRRRDGPRFGPRCIDLDLLLYDDLSLSDPFCTLPHPRLCRRAFCLAPLLELAPDLAIGGVPASELLRRLDFRREGNKIFQ